VSPAVDPLIGAVIAGRYEVVRVIGQGGMGTIYEVRNTRLGRSFALKTLSDSANDEVLGRFRREAEIVAKLNHPNILDVVDWDTLEDGSPCMVMEYLRGEDLSERVRLGGPLTWPIFARIADQVLAALAVAHRAGVVHRDLKPQNIFLAADDNGDERVKLLDFGISKLKDARTYHTTDAKVMGTPAYMPPEQAEGRQEDIGPASDIWAMGTILYEMATGKVAFEGVSIPAILYKVCHGRPRPLVELRPDTPPALIAVIEHALQPKLSDRLGTAEQLRADMRAAMSNLQGISWPEPLRSRTSPAGKSSPAITPVSGVPIAIPRKVDSGPVATGPTIATPSQPKVAQGTAPTVAAGSVDLRVPKPARRLWSIVIPILALAIVGIVGFVASRSSTDPAPEAPPSEPAPPPKAVVAPVATAPTETVTTPAKIEITINSTPDHADVFRIPSDVKVGETPWTSALDKADGAGVFVIKKQGFNDGRVEIDLSTGGSAHVELIKIVGRPVKSPTHSQPDRRKGEPVNPFERKK
jgi:serine/threonine protein kinase